ncbi:gp53-like domain-containing protein [Citrobacter youngae]|uniref:gp53-like domain-containing protein n=1 Tax=Citrobacter youngae TaxID=133448 RepID=UPI00191730C3|nr:phage tail protein [Citrobacter youngae]MBK6262469.1 phage tail protein [Citrobacter youngae]
MNRTDAPAKQPKPFGINGQREPILSTTPAGDNTASYESGFPPITMTLKSAGGLPPKGQDMNQILFELSSLARWSSSGALNTYDSTFAAAIGGYPAGAFVLGDDLKTVYRCTANGNTSNPNSITTGWAKVAQDIADILTLGTAAYKDVGTGTNQIPDMSSFTKLHSGNGYQKLPGGLIIQWGMINGTTGQLSSAYPIAFPNAVFQAVVSLSDKTVNPAAIGPLYVENSTFSSKTTLTVRPVGSDGQGITSARYIAIGY